MPKASVIIPAYNASAFIEKCLESVLSQTLSDIEIIVVDDGSTDATREIVNRLAFGDNRISLIEQENSYAGVARNNGMRHAKGEYLYFLDADDFISKDMLAGMVSRMDEDLSDVALCKSSFYGDDSGNVWDITFATVFPEFDRCYSSDELSENIFQCCVGWPWDKLFRASFVREHSLEYQNLRTTNDALFVFLAMCLAKRVSVVSDNYVYHRTNNSNSLESTRLKSWQNGAKAALSIESFLKGFGIYDKYSRSFIEWLFHFAYWNYSTLSGDAKAGLLQFMENDVLPRLSGGVIDSFSESYERKAAEILISGDSVLETAMDLCVDYQHALREINKLDSSCREKESRYWNTVNELNAKIGDLENRLSESDRELEMVRGELSTLKESTSFKVGRAVTALPRKLRDAAKL